jgi:Fur family ferric uptake transcriptional regulator
MRMIRNRKQEKQIQLRPLTNQRRLLLEILRETEGHLNAKELYQRAIARDESVSQATVYRSLNLFKELGLVDEMRLGGVRCYYEIKKSKEHQHLVCQGCGKILEFQSQYFDKLLEAVRSKYGFKITKAELYLTGYCHDCEDDE